MNELSRDTCRKIWTAAGGSFHGSNVETGSMPEDKLVAFIQGLAEPVVQLHKDDRNKLLGWLVLGAIYRWNTDSGAGLTPESLQRYAAETCSKIITMLDRGTSMDGQWSDLQCVISGTVSHKGKEMTIRFDWTAYVASLLGCLPAVMLSAISGAKFWPALAVALFLPVILALLVGTLVERSRRVGLPPLIQVGWRPLRSDVQSSRRIVAQVDNIVDTKLMPRLAVGDSCDVKIAFVTAQREVVLFGKAFRLPVQKLLVVGVIVDGGEPELLYTDECCVNGHAILAYMAAGNSIANLTTKWKEL